MTNFDDVRQAIERHNANAVRWYAAGDVDSLVSIFAEDAWQMPPHSPPLVGRTAIRDFWRNAVSWGKWEFILETKSVDASGPIAVERSRGMLPEANTECSTPSSTMLKAASTTPRTG